MAYLILTSLEEAIMLSILDQSRYGQDIVEVLSEASYGTYQVSSGTLYPALQRLKHRGLIQDQKASENLTVRNGHSRCYYQVTPEGREVLFRVEEIRSQIRRQSEGPELST
ncbi:MAG: PadR family transcriptional regulator [Nodosilinea sp.]